MQEMERQLKEAKKLLRFASIHYLYDVNSQGTPNATIDELTDFWEQVKQFNDNPLIREQK